MPSLRDLNSTDSKCTNADALCIEGIVVVNMINPGKNQAFQNYCKDNFTPHIESIRKSYSALRVDMAFDKYQKKTLKTATRQKRGKGVRRKVEPQSIAPSNWKAFLRIDENKNELFRYISKEVLQNHPVSSSVEIVCSYDDVVQSSEVFSDLTLLTPTNHEEGDTGVVLLTKDMISKGFRRIVIRTVNTDVLIIAISFFNDLHVADLYLWVEFGVGKNREIFSINTISLDLGPQNSQQYGSFMA